VQVAYVLGQLQNKAAASALSDILRNVNEHPMVRHEAAEALGSIAGIFTMHCLVISTYQPGLGLSYVPISKLIFKLTMYFLQNQYSLIIPTCSREDN